MHTADNSMSFVRAAAVQTKKSVQSGSIQRVLPSWWASLASLTQPLDRERSREHESSQSPPLEFWPKGHKT